MFVNSFLFDLHPGSTFINRAVENKLVSFYDVAWEAFIMPLDSFTTRETATLEGSTTDSFSPNLNSFRPNCIFRVYFYFGMCEDACNLSTFCVHVMLLLSWSHMHTLQTWPLGSEDPDNLIPECFGTAITALATRLKL